MALSRLLAATVLCFVTLSSGQDTSPPAHDVQAPLQGQSVKARFISSAPVITNNFPDPSLIHVKENGADAFYSFATRTIGSTVNVQLAYTPDFNSTTWTILNSTLFAKQQYDAMPLTPAWVAPQPNSNVWAPDVTRLPDGSYIMYFSATIKRDTRYHCIGVARSSAIAGVRGPYLPDSTPLICPLKSGGAIDPTGFVDEATGKRYLVYKVDGNSIGNGGVCGNSIPPITGTPIMLQEVDARDGVSFVGNATRLLDNNGVADDGVVEAPSLVRGPGGWYFLFFSSGCYATTNYTVSYAVSSNGVKGPYKRFNTPLLSSKSKRGLRSPGGASVLWQNDPSASVRRLVFHDGPLGDRVMYTGYATIKDGRVSV